MTGFLSEGRTTTSHFVFPEDFIGFQGHFPAKKILPGVSQIQCALSTLEKANKKAVALKEILLAKYLAPIAPGEEVTCVCGEIQEKDGDHTVKAVISRDNTKISELKLRVRFTEKKAGR